MSPSGAGYALAVLFAINLMNFFDRQILGAVGEQIRREWCTRRYRAGRAGDRVHLLYAFVGVPFGRLADRGVRKHILAGGVFIWSLLTAASGLARNFWELFVVRLGVGVGEASCAPAAISLIGDLFRTQHRARATATFMLGLPIGLGLSFLVGGYVGQRWGWRAALFIAAVPGIAVRRRRALHSRAGARDGRRAQGRASAVVQDRRTSWCCRSRRCGGSSRPERCTTSTCMRSGRFSRRSSSGITA